MSKNRIKAYQKVSHYQMSKNRIKAYQRHYFSSSNYMYHSSTMIISIGNKYSMRDLLCDVDVINNTRGAKYRFASHTVNDVSTPCGITCH